MSVSLSSSLPWSHLFRALCKDDLDRLASSLRIESPLGLFAWEPISPSVFAQRLLSLSSLGMSLVASPLSRVGGSVVCAVPSHTLPRTWNVRLPVPVGFTAFLDFVLPHMPRSEQMEGEIVYDVGDRQLGGQGDRLDIVARGTLLSRTVAHMFEGSKLLQLSAHTGDVTAVLHCLTIAERERESRSLSMQVGPLILEVSSTTLDLLRGVFEPSATASSSSTPPHTAQGLGPEPDAPSSRAPSVAPNSSTPKVTVASASSVTEGKSSLGVGAGAGGHSRSNARPRIVESIAEEMESLPTTLLQAHSLQTPEDSFQVSP